MHLAELWRTAKRSPELSIHGRAFNQISFRYEWLMRLLPFHWTIGKGYVTKFAGGNWWRMKGGKRTELKSLVL